MAMPAPLEEAGAAIIAADEEEAARTAEERRLLDQLRRGDRLHDEVERLNLDGISRVPDQLGHRIVSYQQEIGTYAFGAGAPTTTAEALARIERALVQVFRKRQPWWWDFEPDDDEVEE